MEPGQEEFPSLPKSLMWAYWFAAAAVLAGFWYFQNLDVFGSGAKYAIPYILSATILSEVLFNSNLHFPGMTIAPSKHPNIRVVAASLSIIVLVICIANF